MDEKTQLEIEAAAWRKMVGHFRKRTDVQNIDLMNQAGFCRNCMAKWIRGAAGERGIDISYDEAREIVYGMPYKEWQAQYQTEATQEQLDRYNAIKPEDITE